MKKIKVCYTIAPNLGDAINVPIMQKVLGIEPKYSSEWVCDVTGIGSGLRRFFISIDEKSFRYKTCRAINNTVLNKEVVIWSAGFLSTPKGNESPLRKRFQVASVRGLLSKEALETIIGSKIKCNVGDAGLLASKLFNALPLTKYSLGIIPHRSDKYNPLFTKIANMIPDSIIIDIENSNTLEEIQKIACCETVLSSSLHGLIFADSFNIPNRHLIVSNNLSGDGFKFRDYYSVYNLGDQIVDQFEDKWYYPDSIKKLYKIKMDQVSKIQFDSIDSFHRYFN